MIGQRLTNDAGEVVEVVGQEGGRYIIAGVEPYAAPREVSLAELVTHWGVESPEAPAEPAPDEWAFLHAYAMRRAERLRRFRARRQEQDDPADDDRAAWDAAIGLGNDDGMVSDSVKDRHGRGMPSPEAIFARAAAIAEQRAREEGER